MNAVRRPLAWSDIGPFGLPLGFGSSPLNWGPRDPTKSGRAKPQAACYGSRIVMLCTTGSRGLTGTIVMAFPITTSSGTLDWEVIE